MSKVLEWDLVDEWISALEKEYSYGKQIAIGRKIHGAFSQAEGPLSGAGVRTAVLSSYTVEPFVYYLTAEFCRLGIPSHVYLPDFGQFKQEIINPESGLYRHKPEVVYLHVGLFSLLPHYDQYQQTDDSDIQFVLDALQDLCAAFKQNCKGVLVLSNFPVPSFIPVAVQSGKMSVKEWHQKLNCDLENLYKEDEQVHVFDYELLINSVGKYNCTNQKMYYLGSIEWSETLLPYLAREYIGYVIAAKGLTKKCIVLDLDNTLWGGIVGEDGINGISLSNIGHGQEYHDFQRIIKTFTERGVLLAINSKNNYDDAMEVIQGHPHMVLKEKQFASIQINWKDKPLNIQAIAKELNIATNSMVFFDDNPVECDRMRALKPEILTVCLPRDHSMYRQTVEQMAFYFRALTVTEEDRQRGGLYVAQRSRHVLAQKCGTPEDFYKNLEMKLEAKTLSPADLNRVSQLTLRTNQFNFTTWRLTVNELEELVLSGDYVIYTLRVVDKFGDNGLVGAAVINISTKGQWVLKNFLLSCRVLGRTVEKAFMLFLLKEALANKIESLVCEFIESPKNKPARIFLQSFPEISIHCKKDEKEVYEIITSGMGVCFDEWIEFE